MTSQNKKGEYPRDLYTATRAEYVTRIRMMNKRPGCPLHAMTVLIVLLSLWRFLS